MLTKTSLTLLGVMIEQSCKLLQYRVKLSQEQGSGTSSVSLDEHLPMCIYRKDLGWLRLINEPRV